MSHRGHRESMNGKIETLYRKEIGNRDSRIDGESDLRSRDDESVIFAEREKACSTSRENLKIREKLYQFGKMISRSNNF